MNFLLICFFSNAYIPSLQTVLGRLVDGAGKSAYKIEQTLQFVSDDGSSLTVKENWTVINSENMFLTAIGKMGEQTVFKVTKNYRGSQTIHMTKDGRVSREGHAPDFYFDLFFIKSQERLVNRFKRHGILPDEFEWQKEKVETLDEVRYDSSPWFRLSRKGGNITYKVSAAQVKNKPAAWIVQDRFVLSALRLSTTEVIRNNYETYTRGLRWASKSTIQWLSHSVTSNVVRVVPFKHTSKELAELVSPERLKPLRVGSELSGDLSKMVTDFYSRVR